MNSLILKKEEVLFNFVIYNFFSNGHHCLWSLKIFTFSKENTNFSSKVICPSWNTGILVCKHIFSEAEGGKGGKVGWQL